MRRRGLHYTTRGRMAEFAGTIPAPKASLVRVPGPEADPAAAQDAPWRAAADLG